MLENVRKGKKVNRPQITDYETRVAGRYLLFTEKYCCQL
jgi:hypothetical protein